MSTDEVSAVRDHHAATGQKTDAAELHFPYSKLTERRFARRLGLADSERAIANTIARTEESVGPKIFLPWRSNEPRFAPQQYYYAASKKWRDAELGNFRGGGPWMKTSPRAMTE